MSQRLTLISLISYTRKGADMRGQLFNSLELRGAAIGAVIGLLVTLLWYLYQTSPALGPGRTGVVVAMAPDHGKTPGLGGRRVQVLREFTDSGSGVSAEPSPISSQGQAVRFITDYWIEGDDLKRALDVIGMVAVDPERDAVLKRIADKLVSGDRWQGLMTLYLEGGAGRQEVLDRLRQVRRIVERVREDELKVCLLVRIATVVRELNKSTPDKVDLADASLAPERLMGEAVEIAKQIKPVSLASDGKHFGWGWGLLLAGAFSGVGFITMSLVNSIVQVFGKTIGNSLAQSIGRSPRRMPEEVEKEQSNPGS